MILIVEPPNNCQKEVILLSLFKAQAKEQCLRINKYWAAYWMNWCSGRTWWSRSLILGQQLRRTELLPGFHNEEYLIFFKLTRKCDLTSPATKIHRTVFVLSAVPQKCGQINFCIEKIKSWTETQLFQNLLRQRDLHFSWSFGWKTLSTISSRGNQRCHIRNQIKNLFGIPHLHWSLLNSKKWCSKGLNHP